MSEEYRTLWGDDQAVDMATRSGRQPKEHKYWKKPDGWVAIGPRVQSDPFDYQRHIQVKRWRELPDSFGYEPVGSTARDSMTVGVSKFKKFMNNGGLTARDENGDYGPPGAPIMPGAQIVTLLGHRDPKVLAARPDVAENAVDLECPYGCTDPSTASGRRLFHGWGKADAEKSLHQHITASHEDAVAAEAVGKQNQEALMSAAKMFASQAGGGGQFDAQQMAAIMAQAMIMVQQMQGQSAPLAPVVVNEPAMKEEPATMDFSGRPDMTWQRKHMWQWCKANGITLPTGFAKWTADETLKYIESLP